MNPEDPELSECGVPETRLQRRGFAERPQDSGRPRAATEGGGA